MGSESNGKQSQSHSHVLALTLNQVQTQLGDLSSMNLLDLLNHVWSWTTQDTSLEREPSFALARAFSGKSLNQVWEEIRQGQKKRFGHEGKEAATLGELTLEDLLVQAGLFANPCLNPSMDFLTMDPVTPQCFPHEPLLPPSPSPSVGTLSDTTTTSSSGPKRDASDALDQTIDRRLKRKIKNRESAARSRARKQAYHSELVSKVSRLEEDNMKLKKERVQLHLDKLDKTIGTGLIYGGAAETAARAAQVIDMKDPMKTAEEVFDEISGKGGVESGRLIKRIHDDIKAIKENVADMKEHFKVPPRKTTGVRGGSEKSEKDDDKADKNEESDDGDDGKSDGGTSDFGPCDYL